MSTGELEKERRELEGKICGLQRSKGDEAEEEEAHQGKQTNTSKASELSRSSRCGERCVCRRRGRKPESIEMGN